MKQLPSKEYLKSLFHYDPETGVLTWNHRPRNHFKSERFWKRWGTLFAGKKAGSLQKSTGYRAVNIDKTVFVCSRIIMTMEGHNLSGLHVDHIDHNQTNDRRCNLRVVTISENNKNIKKSRRNTSGHVGVSWDKASKKWHAQIKVNYKSKCLGYYIEKEKAITARKSAEVKHGFHPNHGL